MPRTRAVIVALVLAAAAVPGRAEANASASLSSPDGVLYDDCRDHPYSWTFDVEDGYDFDVSVTAEAYGPDGIEAASDFQTDADTSGQGALMFCGGEMAGRYRLEAEVQACDYDYDCYTFELPGSWFTMRAPRTRTTLSVTPQRPRFNQVTVFRIGTRDERPNGYFPTDGTYVLLEAKVRDGGWAKVKASRTYAWDGKAAVKYRWNVRRPITVRARTAAYDGAAGSVSKPVTVRVR